MPGTRTAPTVDGAPATKTVSLSWIDASGDVRTDQFRLLSVVADTVIEALVVALQAGSNASLWRVKVSEEYGVTKDKNNALSAPKSESVFDHLAFTAKHVTDVEKRTKRAIFPAPIASMLVDGSDTLDPASPEIIAMLAAWMTAIGAGAWDVEHGTYTEKSEVNERVNI